MQASAIAFACGFSLVFAACTPPSRRGAESANVTPPTDTATAPPPPSYTPVPAPLPPPPVTQQPPVRKPPTLVVVKPPIAARPPEGRPPVATPPTPAVRGCGEVAVGAVQQPLDCFTKDYVKVQGASAAVARAQLQSGSAGLPDYVDHRHDKVEGPIRDQQGVGDGAAMALAGAIDQALSRNGRASQPVSALQIWGRAPKPNLGALVAANLGKAVSAESTLGYDAGKACAWASPDAARLCKSPGESTPDADLAKADAAPFAKLMDIVEIDGTSGDALRGAIAKNEDVLVVLRVDPEAFHAVVGSPDPEPLIQDYVGTNGIQTVTLVGYAKQDNAFFYLVKNSWGTGWGRDGYAWIGEATLKKNVIEAYLVQASPASAATTGTTATTCPAGQVPDAATKQCAPPCPDHSPRTNGVCPDTSKNACPPGFVNTTGRCVVAAPDRSGSDARTGIAFVCGSAGCTYTWKKGSALDCSGDVCSLSCPAPKYLAAVNPQKKTIQCTE